MIKILWLSFLKKRYINFFLFYVGIETLFCKRLILRGYSCIKREKKLKTIRQIKRKIAGARVPSLVGLMTSGFFINATSYARNIVHQYILQNFIEEKFNKSILIGAGEKNKIISLSPKYIREILISESVKIDQIGSSIYWMSYIIITYIKNTIKMARLFGKILLSQANPIMDEPYVYFSDLTFRNLPRNNEEGKSYDFISWYLNSSARNKKIRLICHNVKGQPNFIDGIQVKYMDEPWCLIRGGRNLVLLFIWCLYVLTLSGVSLLLGRWWYTLLLVEAMKAKAISCIPNNVLAAEYLFPFSESIYRPLWTYEAQYKKSFIKSFFYANYEELKTPNGYESQEFIWKNSTWPVFLVWDKYQEILLRRNMIQNATFEIVGPVWFQATPIYIKNEKPAIAVFDIEPKRTLLYQSFNTRAEYLAAYPELSKKYFNDIYSVLLEFNLFMIIKRKREYHNYGLKNYSMLMNDLASRKNVLLMPTETSAFQLIEKCVGSISIPFTSTALCNGAQKFPSCYYDPSGWIQKNDSASHGVPIISGIDELKVWFTNSFKS